MGHGQEYGVGIPGTWVLVKEKDMTMRDCNTQALIRLYLDKIALERMSLIARDHQSTGYHPGGGRRSKEFPGGMGLGEGLTCLGGVA